MNIPSNTVTIGGTTKKSQYDSLYNNAILANVGGTAGGVQEIPGEKTFLSGTIFESGIETDTINSRTSTNGVAIDSMYSNESGTISTISFSKKIIAIGTWNMTADSSVNLTISGITKSQIRSVQVLVNGNTGIDSANLEEGGYWRLPGLGSVTIQLFRYSSEIFDTINFAGTANRGFVVFDYAEE